LHFITSNRINIKKILIFILVALFICSPAYAVSVPIGEIRELQSKVEQLEIAVENLRTETRSCRIELGFVNEKYTSLEKVVKSFQESMLSLQKIVLNFVQVLISKLK